MVINIVNAALTLSFFTRGLYILGTLLGLSLLPAIPLQRDQDVAMSVLICFEAWDYIPTILLLLFVTSRPLGANSSSSFRLFGTTVNSYHSMDDDSSADRDGGYYSSKNSSGRSHRSDSGCYGVGNDKGGGTGQGRTGGWLSGWFGYGSIPLHDSMSEDEDEFTMSRRSRNGSRVGASRNNKWNQYDRPARGISSSSIAPALDQLEIEIESDMHTQPVQAIVPWGDGERDRRDRQASLGSLERFAAPSSLEPQKSWLSPDRLAMGRASFGSPPTSYSYGTASISSSTGRDVSAGTSPSIGPSNSLLSQQPRSALHNFDYFQAKQNRGMKHNARPRTFSYGLSPPSSHGVGAGGAIVVAPSSSLSSTTSDAAGGRGKEARVGEATLEVISRMTLS